MKITLADQDLLRRGHQPVIGVANPKYSIFFFQNPMKFWSHVSGVRGWMVSPELIMVYSRMLSITRLRWREIMVQGCHGTG